MFLTLTFAHLEALEERRAIRLRHARYDAALITATVLNVNASSREDMLSPFDLIPGFAQDPNEREQELHRRNVVRDIRRVFLNKPDATAEEVKIMRDKITVKLLNSGLDPDEMFAEAFPNL